MYSMIKINPEHTYLQNILWREDPTKCLKCIELLTVTYGTNSAPYLATTSIVTTVSFSFSTTMDS